MFENISFPIIYFFKYQNIYIDMSEVAELLDRLPGSASFVTQDQASLVLSHYTFDQLIGFRVSICHVI